MVSKLSTPHDLALYLVRRVSLILVLALTVFDIIFAVGWMGQGWLALIFVIVSLQVPLIPFLYFQKIINCHAFYGKYCTQGVWLPGRVVKTWLTKEAKNNKNVDVTNIQVLYQVDECRYHKNLKLPEQQPLNLDVDLVLVPGYPKSAILYDSIKNVDPDFPPTDQGGLPFVILFTTFISFLTVAMPLSIVLSPLDNAWLATFLFGIILFATVVVGFMAGYLFATSDRDEEFHKMLYDAKVADADDGAVHIFSLEEHISYEEFCQLDNTHRPSYQTVLRVAVVGTLWCVYFSAFLGCFLVWYGFGVPRWKKQFLERYESESDMSRVVGSVICKDNKDYLGVTGVIVRYKAENQSYKKLLNLPAIVIQDIPDSPELVYLKGLPESVIYKGTILDQHNAQKAMKCQMIGCVFGGLFFMAYQIGLPCGLFLNGGWGFLLTCNFVMGFVGVWIHCRTVVEREILYGAKLVEEDQGTCIDNIETPNEEAHNTRMHDTETDTTLSTIDDEPIAETSVASLTKGVFT